MRIGWRPATVAAAPEASTVALTGSLSGCGTADASRSAIGADTTVEMIAGTHLKYFTYQPAGRFWHFQLIEGSWLLVLSVLLAAATVWLIRRRATEHQPVRTPL
jgi:hypothetical protein